jgi:hypothetical protein
MLATTRPMRRGPAPRFHQRDMTFLSVAGRRVGTFVLARPGTVALVLLFGTLGAAVSVNALWMQSEHHPAPLFHQAALQPQHIVPLPPKKAPETPAVAAAPAADDAAAAAAMLPPARPAGLGRAAEAPAAAPGKPAAPKRPAKDPIADLLGGTAPVPPASIKPAAAKAQPIDKTVRPAVSAPANDAIAGLIEQTSRSR